MGAGLAVPVVVNRVDCESLNAAKIFAAAYRDAKRSAFLLRRRRCTGVGGYRVLVTG